MKQRKDQIKFSNQIINQLLKNKKLIRTNDEMKQQIEELRQKKLVVKRPKYNSLGQKQMKRDYNEQAEIVDHLVVQLRQEREKMSNLRKVKKFKLNKIPREKIGDENRQETLLEDYREICRTSWGNGAEFPQRVQLSHSSKVDVEKVQMSSLNSPARKQKESTLKPKRSLPQNEQNIFRETLNRQGNTMKAT